MANEEHARFRILRAISERESRLNLSGLGLTELPGEIGKLTDLRELWLNGNRLSALPESVGELTALAMLILDGNQLTALPESTGKLTSLTALLLDGNRLSALPDSIGGLTSLKTLRVERNQLTALPESIGGLTSLTTLRLTANELNALPESIGKLTSLATLTLNGNQLSALPESIGELSALTELYLDGNRLSALPESIGKLTSLAKLDVEGNQLSELPESTGKLSSLIALLVGGNYLSTLPESIGRLTSLTTLRLYGNQLSALPESIGKLTSLVGLYLDGNQLSALPESIGGLTSLVELFVFGNQLSALPQSLQDLQHLAKLDLGRNEALQLPEELLRPTTGRRYGDARPILDYYFSRQTEGEEPMREVRLLLVGRGRVGKTSLLKALRGESPDKNERETPGINVLPLRLDCPQGAATGHVWDFGGQEFLHGTHQIFLAERCVYLLVLEGRESNWETETDYWLRFIQSFGGDSPVIVVLTKHDEHPFSVDRFRLQERSPQIVDFVETDAFTGRGVRELTQLLERVVDGMREVWLPLPKKWHRVKEALTGMSESYLEYGEYQELCESTGVNDANKQDSLAQALHRLGIALNFRDHHRLKSTSVLKPQWVTEAVYGLIRYAQKRESHGVMELSWMAEALDPSEYPSDKHGFVLELMEKFEVAFALEGTQSWLIPELLPEEQPQAFEEFRGPAARRLRFEYPDALPPGLLPRFIVRTHEMSSTRPEWRWRSGVAVEWRGARALVRLNRMERRTEVALVGGSEEAQQSLFDFIRAELIQLHGKVRVFEDVELKEYPDSWVRVGKLRRLEEKGKEETEEESRDGDLVTVKVTETLNGVESLRAREAERGSAPPRMQLFVSYAHKDKKDIAPLSTHLTILGRRGYIQAWDDTQLVAGEKWKDRILEELDGADIVLLLYSSNSRASAFIQEIEGPKAVERAKGEGRTCTLLVVPLDRNDWDDSAPLERELREFQTATWEARPVWKFRPKADGWLEVEQSIRKAVELLRDEL